MSTENTKTAGSKSDKMSKIDQMIAQAKADKAKRAPGEKPPKPAKQPKAADPEKAKEKAEKLAAREAKKAATLAAREAKKSERATASAAKKAEKQAAREAKAAAKQPAHLAKLAKAEAKLPALTPETIAFMSAASGLSAVELQTAAEHLAFKARSMQTSSALTTKIEQGDTVTIMTGKHAGKVGTVSEAKRIRCFVTVPGVERPVYLFTSDVTKVGTETVIADGTENTSSDEETSEVAAA